MINPMKLTGKHVVITGASAGIGRATAVQASKLGAKVSMIARNEDRLEETHEMLEGDGHTYYSYDLMNIDGIQDLIKKIVADNGAIDGLAHCAGIGTIRPIKYCNPDYVQEMMTIHFFAFAELVRVASSMKNSNKGASYVGVSSTAAVRGDKGQGPYSAAKGAMNSVLTPFSKELNAKGIRINTVAFAMVDTYLYQNFLESGCDEKGLFAHQFLGLIPVEYAGNAICYLLSDAARYITGTVLNYDAGFLL